MLVCALLFGWDALTEEDVVGQWWVSIMLAAGRPWVRVGQHEISRISSLVDRTTFVIVAGIMTFISLHELYPSALEATRASPAVHVASIAENDADPPLQVLQKHQKYTPNHGKDQAMAALVTGMLAGAVVVSTFGEEGH